MTSTSSSVSRAIVAGKVNGFDVRAWGSDLVRIDGSRIMSASDAIRWMTTGTAW